MISDAGFVAEERVSPLRGLIKGSVHDYLTKWADKLKIAIVGDSTFLYCVPDPYGVLEEGEIFCSLSQKWKDPRTGISSCYIKGIDGLVARNPANHPSDIQRVKLVFKLELLGFQDVIIFSTKGARPLASYLSGGDYDGDKCWLCWRPNIVDQFVNYAEGPPDHISPQSCGMIERSKRLDSIVDRSFTSSSVNTFLTGCFDFNLKAPMVGIVTNEHEKVVYHRSLSDKGAIKLAALAAFLVDARKQGLELPEEVWHKLRAECSGKARLTPPAYKDSTSGKYKDSNINDRLRFKVAQRCVDDALKHYSLRWPSPMEYTSDLASIWINAWNRVEKEKENGNGRTSTALPVLQKLINDVDEVYELWKKLSPPRSDDNPGNHPEATALCFEQFSQISPLQGVPEDDLHRRYQDELGRKFSNWNLLRASRFYCKYWSSMVTWYMAGDELCFLEAEKKRMRSMAASVYAVTKIDSKAANREFPSESFESFETSFTGPMDEFLRSRG